MSNTIPEAVELALSFGASSERRPDGSAGPAADLAAWALLRGSESVQHEIDRWRIEHPQFAGKPAVVEFTASDGETFGECERHAPSRRKETGQ